MDGVVGVVDHHLARLGGSVGIAELLQGRDDPPLRGEHVGGPAGAPSARLIAFTAAASASAVGAAPSQTILAPAKPKRVPRSTRTRGMRWSPSPMSGVTVAA